MEKPYHKLCFNASEFFGKYPEIKPYLFRRGLVGFKPHEGGLMIVIYSNEEDQKAAHDDCRPLVKFLGFFEGE